MSPSQRYDRIAFVASAGTEAQQALKQLTALNGNCDPAEAEIVVALGGDGLMLQTLHMTMRAPKPIYGMNRGSVGFLMNDYSDERLPERLRAALTSIIHPHPTLSETVGAAGEVFLGLATEIYRPRREKQEA